ncbi:complement C1r subcomponent-like protein isoform X2 [Tribolium madens]|uniref:complement C1r subcomponent-like protein isoform X2 n=1 Tax=Tribolium madens TaxID=41895 RepID=UPI001CF7622D|nr:complement C1r subcomponent-like protein isoform X2 [Tribolium madens]
MNKIHSRILALVLSIFLIHAADPPVQRPSGAFIQYLPKNNQTENFQETIEQNTEKLKLFHDYLINIKNESPENSRDKDASTNHDAINRFLQRERKTQYEKLLEKDFIRPLLKLYEQHIHQEPDYTIGNSSTLSRISKEDHVEDFKVLSKDDLDELIHGGETYQQNHKQDTDQHIARRDDTVDGSHDEHIGEILPPGYQPPKMHRFSPVRRFYYQPSVRSRKSYDEGFKTFRKPVIFPGERFRPEYEPSGLSSEGFESDYRPEYDINTEESRSMFTRPTRLGLPPNEVPGFRLPRRLRGFPENFPSTAREPYWQSPWASSRRPRVIFPSDLVAFREPNGNQEEPDWLAGDNNLQDIQEQDTRDRGCGISTNRQQAQRRIVGGEEAGFGTFPWQAYIRIGSSRCGGSLVSRRHVVTAGHCVARATPRQVHVTLGDYVINSAVEPLPAYTFGVSQIQVHPFFKFTPQADRFDVAVLRLDRTAHQLPHITPICLPPRGESFLGEVGVAAGWGALSPGSRLRPQTLQAVQVPVIDNRVCERWHRSKGIGVTIYDEMMCAGYKNGGRDSCQGDSGGPLMLQKQGRWYLIGIVSAGYSCAQPGQPGIYHRVAHTVDWITRAIGV